MKLYTTMPMEKMAAFQEMIEDDFRNALLCFKHKMRNMVWTKGTSGLQGDFQSDSEVSCRKILLMLLGGTCSLQYEIF